MVLWQWLCGAWDGVWLPWHIRVDDLDQYCGLAHCLVSICVYQENLQCYTTDDSKSCTICGAIVYNPALNYRRGSE